MPRWQSIVLAVMAFAVGVFCTWLVLVPLGDRFIPLFFKGDYYDSWLNTVPAILALMALGGVICAALAWQCSRRNMNALFVRTLFIIYIILGIYLIMGKTHGQREINLNPLDLIDQLRWSPDTVALNMAIFIPLGILLYAFRSPWKAFGAALAADIAMESAQYVFALGIADIVDVIMNMSGFAIGYLLAVWFHRKWRIELHGGRYLIIPIGRQIPDSRHEPSSKG